MRLGRCQVAGKQIGQARVAPFQSHTERTPAGPGKMLRLAVHKACIHMCSQVGGSVLQLCLAGAPMV